MSQRVILSATNDLSKDQRVHRIAMTLHESGWDLTVVGCIRDYREPLSARPYKTKRFQMLFTKGKLFYFFFNLRLFGYLLFHRADVLHANDLDSLLPNYSARRLKGCKLVYDSHEYFTELPELISRPRTRSIWLRLEQRLFPKLKTVCTVNESIAKIYSEKYKVDVKVVRNLPLKRAEVGQPHREKIILYQGAVNLGRGVELMVDAMVHLPEFRLHIYGGGIIVNEIQNRIKQLQLHDRIVCMGWIPFEQLSSKTSEAIIGLSLEEDIGANYHLALPNKLFDYIQSGVPVLVSDLPEMKNVVDTWQVGEVLPANQRTPEQLAQRIRDIADNQEKWSGYYEKCLIARHELCWEKEQGKLLELYEE